MSPESFIIETVSSQWLRFPNGFQKATCIVDLPNDLALNINSKTGKIEVHEKKADGVYKLVGNIKMVNTTKFKQSPSEAESLIWATQG
jgi:hypothetical protein